MIGFNLITDDWIPVSSLRDNISRRVGIRKLLNEADQYRGVQGTTPLETAAIYRLLIAFIHSAYAHQEFPQDVSDIETWKQAWEQRSFDESVIAYYCDKYKAYFNLFDSMRPFYQDPELTGKPESVSSLMSHIASGADATLFSHNTQANSIQLTLDQVACAIVTIQAFGLAGTKGSNASFNDAPCARGIMFFIEGDTLFETLMLNLPELDLRSHRLKLRVKDCPAWEQPNSFVSDSQRPYGLLDHLTWHNRRIHLIEPEKGSNLVKDMIYAPGLKTYDPKTKAVREVFNPFHHWKAKAEDSDMRDQSGRSHSPIVFRQDKALWRDSAVLFELSSASDQRNKPPAALSRVRTLAAEGIVPYEQTYRLLAIGACTKPGQDKTFFYRMENLPLPMKYLDHTQSQLVSDLGTALELAEKTGKLNNRCAFLLAWLIRSPSTPDKSFDESDKKFGEQTRIDNKMSSGKNDKSKDREAQQVYQLFSSFGVERLYWSQLEVHFQRLIQDLPTEPEAAKETWRKHLKRVARTSFKQAITYAGADRRAQRAIVKAEEQFRIGLANLLNVKPINSTNGGNTFDSN